MPDDVSMPWADSRKKDSLASRMRRKRMGLFLQLIEPIAKPIRVLDVGGDELFWENIGLLGDKGFELTLMNIEPRPSYHPDTVNLLGDARNLNQFRDGEFDVVFSNSVIEHVGGFEDQQKMAREVVRVGKRYFIQTPNLYFPIEPHFLFPFFQFFPIGLKVRMVQSFDLGWFKREEDIEKAYAIAASVRLLSKKEFQQLFPKAIICEEKFMGLVKSFMAYGGF